MTLRCLLKHPGKPVEEISVPPGQAGLKEMERHLGCDCFDSVNLSLHQGKEFALFVDDEGLRKGLAPNIWNPRGGPYPLVGPVLLVKHDHVSGAQLGLTDEEVKKFTVILLAHDMQRCRVCGCTEFSACEGGCDWAEDEDLCTSCVGKEARP